ncbi:hypothetical protein KUTeg_017499 [Tegillarca granosa]|uniref:Uncharacterized protein n=1 Tax=Tegillarca granosa TaxID=220873 RepID=A0ABQ9EHL8_TEGGR|nr:hypothetical protein KUTeg_017499 [Tegillarca granosa]
MHRYYKKKILFIDFPFKQFSILVDILNEFEMLEVVDIRLCYKDIQNNYKCWVRNITRTYDGILIVVTKQLNELIQKQCDKSQSWIEVTQCYIPIITHLIKHLDEHQCADFEKYVINFDGSSNTQDFLNRFTTFRNGKIFSLVSLHEHFVNSTLEKDVLLKYFVSSMMSNMNIKNKDDVIITALRNINTKYSEYEL